ncbi:MFS transporter [Candidatus Amarolinea dominans]|uniref:MFS transporter n=1 Tax=Candidatus Amarolinea dominans TaxID=3140696 RepID=UPI003134CDA6|nr:MFS transporter [Anaerolineae bacterium]
MTPKRQFKIGLILLAYVAFISLGLPDGLLGVAWPSMRADFALPLDALGMLLVASTAGYLTSSFFSGRIMARMGVGGLLAASCAATGGSLLGYTLAPSWWAMIPLGVGAGLGAGAIDAGLNTYIASHHGESLMQWLHASFGVGITLGPIIMTTGLNLFGAWRVGYVVVGVAQLALAGCFAVTASLWRQNGTAGEADAPMRLTDFQTPLRETLRQRGAWLSILMFFIYTGIEVTLGLWAYTLLTESRGIAPAIAGLWAGSYWGTFTVGRVMAGLYAPRVGANRLVQISLLGALVGALLLWWNPAQAVSLFGVGLVGFAVAPIFPALVSGTSGRVSMRHAANTIGMQISAAGLGAALLPTVAGSLARYTSLEAIPVYLAMLIVTLIVLHHQSTR